MKISLLANLVDKRRGFVNTIKATLNYGVIFPPVIVAFGRSLTGFTSELCPDRISFCTCFAKFLGQAVMPFTALSQECFIPKDEIGEVDMR